MFTLVLGTNNRKKGLELAELLRPNVSPNSIAVRTLADFERKLDVVEDGKTFFDNARKKAIGQARFLNSWVIGEDSGLCVDALDGAPGVYSARFSSRPDEGNADDDSNNRYLLESLASVPLEKRTAHYVCAAVLADPSGTVQCESEGICRGRILFEPSGKGGFGYDPLFEVLEYHQTFGTLSAAVKRAVSHRARAIRQLVSLLVALPDKR